MNMLITKSGLDSRLSNWFQTYIRIDRGRDECYDYGLGDYFYNNLDYNHIYSCGDWEKVINSLYEKKSKKVAQFMSLCQFKNGRWDDKIADMDDDDIADMYTSISNYEEVYAKTPLHLSTLKSIWKRRFDVAYRAALVFNAEYRYALIHAIFDDQSKYDYI